MHKSGFVSIVGFPNVGKSTLLNVLLGEKLVIVSPKIQTTRHRILGIYNDDETQIVFSDTPGFISTPHYALHNTMNDAISGGLKDADLTILLTEPQTTDFGELGQKLMHLQCPLVILINKADTSTVEQLNDFALHLEKEFTCDKVFVISALHRFNTDRIIPLIKTFIPEHPPFFPKDELSDRTTRFFISEIIREKIFLQYRKEIPYSSEVLVEDYKESENITIIKITIYVERESQKMIILGKAGSAIKQLGIESRKAIEQFIGQHIHLDITVKVLKNWRNDTALLKKLGYQI